MNPRDTLAVLFYVALRDGDLDEARILQLATEHTDKVHRAGRVEFSNVRLADTAARLADRILIGEPDIYPCGCSRHKVVAGLCSVYGVYSVKPTRWQVAAQWLVDTIPGVGKAWRAWGRLVCWCSGRHQTDGPTSTWCTRCGRWVQPIKHVDIQVQAGKAVNMKPEAPPNRVEVLNMYCWMFGHRRHWQPHHEGSQWEVLRCTRCGDTHDHGNPAAFRKVQP